MDSYKLSNKVKTRKHFNALITVISQETTTDTSNAEDKRYSIGMNTTSFLQEDEDPANLEDTAFGNLAYLGIIRFLSTDREKFIALALDIGYEKKDIAYMLDISRSQVTRIIQDIRVKISLMKINEAKMR